MFKSLLAAIIPLTFALATPKADAQIRVSVGIAPPQAYIATTQPEYFEGRPVYWYNDNWYYRDHGRWSYYRSEPGYLRERRGHWGERGRGHERVEHERVEHDRDRDRGHREEPARREPERYRYRR
jgi:hypothetical protein